MFNIIKKTVSGFVLLLAMCFYAQKAAAQPGVQVSMQTFYDELEPYGQWIDDPELGYVWAPDAGPDFKPYATNGHWAATELGNTWVSDYDWGWAAFHYGRWRFANDYGWEWIPGTEWAPAWVNWRTGGDYYGWAPLGPGIDIDLSFGANYYEPDNYWIFAPRRYVYEPNIYRYYLPANRNFNVIHNTTIINNVYVNNSRRYISGPRPDDVRRYTNASINIYNINDSRRPGGARIQNNTLNIYRPQIAANQNNGNRPEPNRVINRGSYNRNQNLNNGNQPVNQGNSQNNPSSNNNNGFGRNNNNNANGGNQIPQRVSPNQNQNNTNQNNGATGLGAGGAANPNGNNTANPVTGRSNPANQSAQPTNSQPNTDWRQSRNFDHNRTRNDNPVQLNQAQPNQNQQQTQQNQQQAQQRQQQMQQNQQQAQQNQQQTQQRQQQMQQNQQQAQQNQQQVQQRQQQNQQQNQQRQQQNQQQNQQRQQQMQQRQMQRQQQPQRPARTETPERNNRG